MFPSIDEGLEDERSSSDEESSRESLILGTQLFLLHLPLSAFHCSSSLTAHSPFVSNYSRVVFNFAESALISLLTPSLCPTFFFPF